jgi:hypothetical protein
MAIPIVTTLSAPAILSNNSMPISNTSAVPTARRLLSVEWERHWCSTAGVGTFVVLASFPENIITMTETQHWHFDNLYNSIFGLGIFDAGFLFALYTYTRTTENKILDSIRRSVYFTRASKYMFTAMLVAVCLSILTIPLLVTVPEFSRAHQFYWLFFAWCSFTIYCACLTIRSLRHFIIVLNTADPRRS